MFCIKVDLEKIIAQKAEYSFGNSKTPLVRLDSEENPTPSIIWFCYKGVYLIIVWKHANIIVIFDK